MEQLVAQVISLQHREDRRSQFEAHAAEQEIPFVFRAGVTGGRAHVNISRAHKACIRFAMNAGHPLALVMEDDCWFPSKDGFKWFLQNMPAEPFDLYLGGVYGGTDLEDGRVEGFCGLHCYMVHQRFYDRFLDATEEQHLDHALAAMKGRYMLCRPFAAIQRNGYSDNAKKEVNYATYTVGKVRLTSQQ